MLLLAICLLVTACQRGDGLTAPDPTAPGPAPTTTHDSPPADPGTVERIGALEVPRAAHTATRLADGRVLIAGGCSRSGCEGNADALTAELFDPFLGRFAAGPAMTVPRAGHSATLLADGTVLLAGGYAGEGRGPLASAELFDPASNRFVPTGTMAVGRGSHTATALADGRVLIVGGEGEGGRLLNGVELYDPQTGTFEAAEALPVARASHAAVGVGSGAVLVTGGRTADDVVTGTTVLYDPEADRWTPAGSLLEPRYKHAVVALADGGAVVIGGSDEDDFRGRLATLERWAPATDTWTAVASLTEGRFKIPDAVAVLSDGRVVITGDGAGPEVFDPVSNRLQGVRGALETAVMFATATALADDHVLIAGGYDEDIAVSASVYLYRP